MWDERLNMRIHDLKQSTDSPAAILDLWKDISGIHYLGITLVYLDNNWVMQVILLALEPLEFSLTAETIKVCSIDMIVD